MQKWRCELRLLPLCEWSSAHSCEEEIGNRFMWPAVAAAALALATLAAIEPRRLFGDVRTRRSDDEVKPRLFDILS